MVSLCALFIPSQCVQNDITIIHKFWLRLQTLSSTPHRQHTILFADYMITPRIYVMGGKGGSRGGPDTSHRVGGRRG